MRRRAANIRATTHRDTPAAFPSLSSGHGFSAPHWGEWTEWTEPISAGQNRRSASCYEPRGFGKRRSHYFDADADVDFGFGVDGAHQGVGRTLSMGEIHALTASEPPMHCNMARLTPAGNAAAAATAAVPPRQFLRQLGVGGAESPADCAVPHSDDGCGEHHVPEGPQHSGSLLMPAEAAVATFQPSGAAKAGEPSEAVKASEAREAIDLDVRRSSAELEAPLRHVLYGYVAGNPHVGYCQGMDRVARGLLQAGLPAAEALEAFRYLVDSVLPPGLFAAPLVRVQEDQRALEWLVARRLPRVHRHLARVAGGPVHLGAFTVAWMMTLLVDVLPQPAWLRVWDCLFVGDGGYGVVVRACLAVVEALQPQLVECAHAVDACVRLQGAREWMEGADPEAFFACLARK
ncbi:rab-GTPase-TBC domain-containing protein [Kickxella alabastrina]|uniref:rab-GTPase-TBC domain-containing protein n=1 Tax=Kickxella alabastrina TaxID=61397 RepID=UPI00221FEEBA|nr:rab-GTPase-TBC domain-containing protein [Kickxella alabastrina]KAI7833205.1 rab-GTPase-TBC domain-containing protein [Kickxella alabastrina]